MIAEIITIGDEILIGQVIDSNSAWLSARLNETGIAVGQITSIGDEPQALKRALNESSERADIVLMTGGLGPTKDDKTKQILCDYFDGKLVTDDAALENVKRIFSRYNRPLLASNIRQAEVPDNCTVLLNGQGTAPGMWFERSGKVYVSLPGVPFEMMGLVSGQVLPMLMQHFNDRLEPVLHRTLITLGIGESFLAELIAPVESSLPSHIHLAYLPRPGMVRLRLSAYGKELAPAPDAETAAKAEAAVKAGPDTKTGLENLNQPAASKTARAARMEKELDGFLEQIGELAGKYVIADKDISVPEIVLNRLRENGKTLVTAESCTGGYIAHLLTSIPGASEVFNGSIVAYSNQVKSSALGVSPATLTGFGAVSSETVSEMATGALQQPGGDYAIAVSGIMGPGGGSPEKPVGTVWIAVADKGRVQVEQFSFAGRRPQLIERTAFAAMGLLLRFMSH